MTATVFSCIGMHKTHEGCNVDERGLKCRPTGMLSSRQGDARSCRAARHLSNWTETQRHVRDGAARRPASACHCLHAPPVSPLHWRNAAGGGGGADRELAGVRSVVRLVVKCRRSVGLCRLRWFCAPVCVSRVSSPPSSSSSLSQSPPLTVGYVTLLSNPPFSQFILRPMHLSLRPFLAIMRKYSVIRKTGSRYRIPMKDQATAI